MSGKKSKSAKQKLGIPAEVLEDLVSHITLDEMDYDEAEEALEQVKAQLGELAMARIIAGWGEEDRRPKACPRCGKKVPVKALAQPRTIIGLSGEQTIRRNYHYCEGCGEGFYPRDIELGLSKKTPYSPQLEKRILDFGVNEPYGECEERFALHYTSRLSTNAFRQVVKRTGLSIEECSSELLQLELAEPKREAAETLYVMNDGSMLPTREGWKESKAGVVFRASSHVKSSSARRGMIGSARFCAVLGGQDAFYKELSAVLEVEEIQRAKRVVWLADGAIGNWKLASACAKYAIQILDFWHAVENGAECGKVLLDHDSGLLQLWTKRLKQLLLQGDFAAMMTELMDCIVEADDEQLEALNQLIGYYRRNERRMDYRTYLGIGLCIGSGAIESAHRHVLQKRMKLAGQHWSIRAGQQMARLRAAYRTGGAQRLYRSVRRAYRRTQESVLQQKQALRAVV
jgi:hypothetical protein